MSREAKDAWRILVEAAKNGRGENLYGLSVIPEYAEGALQQQILSSELVCRAGYET
jgi:hypothetical protein